jgi:hypothetical protein
VRIAAAIVVDAGAFIIWDLASRSPLRLVRDLGTGLTRPGTAVAGFARVLGGVLLLATGAVLLLPLAIGSRTYLILETWAVLTGLLVEQVLGTDLRTRRP